MIGAGQSALENAALMHEHGAYVEMVARGSAVTWNSVPHALDRPLWKRVRPSGGLCTGSYRVDLARVPFLDVELRAALRTEGTFPVLTRHFETSVPNLYFVGAASSASFGPLMRFVLGARFTARILARRLPVQTRARTRRNRVPGEASRLSGR